MDEIRVGMIGTGWIARDHLGTLRRQEGVKLVGVSDLDLERGSRFAEEAQASAYADWHEMLDTAELDALFVCTPPLAHREPTVTALAGGLPVYLEKPIARTLEDADAIVEAAESSTAPCAVGYQWHALDLLSDVAELLRSEAIGLIVGTSIGPTESRPWFIDRKSGGGNVLERGSHQLDLVRTVGGEVAAARAVASPVRLARDGTGEGDIDDAVTIVLELESGALATIVVAWLKPDQPCSYALDIVSADSTLRLDLDPHFTLTGVSGGRSVNKKAASHPFERSVRQFLSAVRDDDPKQVVCRPDDARRTLAVAAAVEESLRHGTTVQPSRF